MDTNLQINSDSLTHCMPCHSVWFMCVRWSSGSPTLQGFWFIRVHSEPQEFEIFADGNADVCRTESLVSTSNEMVQHAGSRRATDPPNPHPVPWTFPHSVGYRTQSGLLSIPIFMRQSIVAVTLRRFSIPPAARRLFNSSGNEPAHSAIA